MSFVSKLNRSAAAYKLSRFYYHCERLLHFAWYKGRYRFRAFRTTALLVLYIYLTAVCRFFTNCWCPVIGHKEPFSSDANVRRVCTRADLQSVLVTAHFLLAETGVGNVKADEISEYKGD
jgi:hypothetical protein